MRNHHSGVEGVLIWHHWGVFFPQISSSRFSSLKASWVVFVCEMWVWADRPLALPSRNPQSCEEQSNELRNEGINRITSLWRFGCFAAEGWRSANTSLICIITSKPYVISRTPTPTRGLTSGSRYAPAGVDANTHTSQQTTCSPTFMNELNYRRV